VVETGGLENAREAVPLRAFSELAVLSVSFQADIRAVWLVAHNGNTQSESNQLFVTIGPFPTPAELGHSVGVPNGMSLC
jgi:hypothetical protein